MIISSWIRNSYIWTFAKKNWLISFDLNSESACGAGLAKSQLYIPVLLRTLSRDIRIEGCESWFASPTLPPSCSFDLIALKPTESSQGYAPTGIVVQVVSDFREIRWHPVPANLRCSWTRRRFNIILTLLCYSVNSLNKALSILGIVILCVRWCIMWLFEK